MDIEQIVENSEEENGVNLNISKIQKETKTLETHIENEEDTNTEIQESSNNITDISYNFNETEKSKSDLIVHNKIDEKDECTTESETLVEKTKKSVRVIMDSSDSDEEDNQVNITSKNSESKKYVIDSDAEEIVEEEEVTPHNKSFPDEDSAIEAVIYTTNNKGQLIEEDANVKKSSLSLLCDSESSADESENVVESTFIEENSVKPHIYKGRKQKSKEDHPKKMTAKEAAKQREEIHSESQRMLRETNVSLPYHKPKSYTIKEFLQKRSKLASTLSAVPKAPPPVAIKMSKEQLKEVSKKLNERIKEVEQFYKSESEEEDETDDVSKDVRNWLDELVISAMDEVDCRTVESVVAEAEDMEVSSEDIKDKSSNSNQHESMEYDFNLDDLNEETSKKPNISELIKDKLNIQPKLSGDPDDVIDLEEGVSKPSAIKKLVEKFFKHNPKRAPTKHKVKLDVVEVGTRGEIIKETVSMNVDEEEEPALVETPGAKLQKLREELQVQMAQKRLELWKQKHEQGDCLKTEKNTGNEECQGEKDLLDDDEEEEFEMTESESDDEEDEEEYDVQDEKLPKTAFIDEEADEDDNGEEIDEADVEEDDPNDGDIEMEPEEEPKNPKKKVLKRIIKPFSADSDDEDEQSQTAEPAKFLKYYTTDEDDIIPPNLPRVGKTPLKTQAEKNKSEFEFLTPVTYLTGLQNLNSDSKFSKTSPTSPFGGPSEELPSQEESSQGQQSQIQKNLFSENSEPSQNSQENIEDLAQLCSGVFPSTQSGEPLDETEKLPSTQDLLNLCSGDFTSMVSKDSADNLEKKSSSKSIIHIQNYQREEIKSLDDENDQIISQLLDEEELERFKQKFESPINPVVRQSQTIEEVEEVNATGQINSDDENDGLEVKTKKRKKLVFSDEEEEDEDERDEEDEDDDLSEEGEEEIDLHNSEDEEQQLENEIIAEQSNNYKVTDFLDKEAELSESEWGSADEDEKDLDELEEEQGDQETFNEKKMRTELEKIHMRQLMDEDNRELKILQELYLEDGEFHGTGRKKQFRWKLLDSADNGEFDKRDDDDIYLDEEESEEQWRKMRHKREMFLKKKSAQEEDDEDNILGDSQILKIGKQICRSKSISSQNNTPINKLSEECKEPFSLLNKRGSFLSRKDQVLQRLAEYNKVTTNVGTTVKNSKSFVFQTVEANESVVKENNNKRKAVDGTPMAIKKLRLNDLSPAVTKKSTEKTSRAKKLFGNW